MNKLLNSFLGLLLVTLMGSQSYNCTTSFYEHVFNVTKFTTTGSWPSMIARALVYLPIVLLLAVLPFLEINLPAPKIVKGKPEEVALPFITKWFKKLLLDRKGALSYIALILYVVCAVMTMCAIFLVTEPSSKQ